MKAQHCLPRLGWSDILLTGPARCTQDSRARVRGDHQFQPQEKTHALPRGSGVRDAGLGLQPWARRHERMRIPLAQRRRRRIESQSLCSCGQHRFGPQPNFEIAVAERIELASDLGEVRARLGRTRARCRARARARGVESVSLCLETRIARRVDARGSSGSFGAATDSDAQAQL
jgi:hypothetical protein